MGLRDRRRSGRPRIRTVPSWLRALDTLVKRADRWSGLRARRQRRLAQDAGRTQFAYELGRWLGPVAERCGYGEAQIGGTTATFCGDPAEVLTRHPWLGDESHPGELLAGTGHCVDMQVDWREGWVEVFAEPFVRHVLLEPAADRRSIGAALAAVANRLTETLDEQAVLDGVGPWDDPRRPNGSWARLQG